MKTSRLFVVMTSLMTCLLVLSCNKPESMLETKDFAMGTVVTQKVYGLNSKAVASEAIDRIRKLEKMLSFYLTDSDISR